MPVLFLNATTVSHESNKRHATVKTSLHLEL